MEFKLSIRCGGAAFCDDNVIDDDGTKRRFVLAGMLEGIAGRLRRGAYSSGEFIFDINSIKVGELSMRPVEDAAEETEAPASINEVLAGLGACPEDKLMLSQIVKRAAELELVTGAAGALSLMMDLEVVHAKVGLALAGLLAATYADFVHDVCGIGIHLDRNTGQLLDGFSLRCAKN